MVLTGKIDTRWTAIVCPFKDWERGYLQPSQPVAQLDAVRDSPVLC